MKSIKLKHKISIRQQNTFASIRLRHHLKECISTALEIQKVRVPCEINVLLTNNEGIRNINKEFRDIDRETDVLSFPMFQLTPGEFPQDCSVMLDPGSGRLPLGDMCLSLEKAQNQAKEYGHSFLRESGYLTVHSVLHLLGYDHMDEGIQKEAMRRQEELILEQIGITREKSKI